MTSAQASPLISAVTHWPKVSFGDVVIQAKETVDPVTTGLRRYVAGEHMDTDRLTVSRWGVVGDGYLGPAFHRRFRRGQVLYGSRRTYLRKVAVAEFDGVCANTTFVCEPSDDRLSSRLLPFIMQTEAFHAYSISQSKGSVNPYINWKDLAGYEFPLPPRNTQGRLAALLWALEDSVLRLERAEVAGGVGALAAAHHVTRQAPQVELSECLNRIEAGKSPSGTDKPASHGAYGVLKVSAIGDGIFLPDQNKTLIRADDFVPTASVSEGDILLTRANTAELVGRVCRVRATYPWLMLSDKTLRLVPNAGALADYVVLALRLPGTRQQMRVMATGTGGAMKNISQAKLARLRIPLPDVREQERALEAHMSALEVAHALSSREVDARGLKTTLLSALLASV